MMPLALIHSVFTAVGWGGIADSIARLFFGGNYTNSTGAVVPVNGIFSAFGGEAVGGMIAGLIILMFFLIITAIYGMGVLIGSSILIPAMFAVFQFIPPLRIIIAIVVGLILGLGFHKFVKR
jgi:hypothetical protein